MSFATGTIIMITRDKCIQLDRCFRSAHAFTVEPRPIEVADASLPGSEHRAGIRENDETQSPKAESSPNDKVRKCSGREETDGGDSSRIAGGKLKIQSWRAIGVMSDHNACALD